MSSATFATKLRRRVDRAAQRFSWAMANRRARVRIREEAPPSERPLGDITRYEMKIFSQHGEDGIIEALFTRLGVTNKFCVEFGVGSGKECNTRHLIERRGWRGLWMTGNEFSPRKGWPLKREFITAENINTLFEKYEVPRDFDLLNIDIDGNDYWVWRQLKWYRPRVVCMEYNPSIPPTEATTIPYDPKFIWNRTDFYGASLLALTRLGRAKGYELVGCDKSGTNAFFVQNELAGNFEIREVGELYRRGEKILRHDPREMIEAPL